MIKSTLPSNLNLAIFMLLYQFGWLPQCSGIFGSFAAQSSPLSKVGQLDYREGWFAVVPNEGEPGESLCGIQVHLSDNNPARFPMTIHSLKTCTKCSRMRSLFLLIVRAAEPLSKVRSCLLRYRNLRQDTFFLLERHLAQAAWSLSVLNLICIPQSTHALDQGESNHGKLSARGPEAKDYTASLQRRFRNLRQDT